MYVIMMILIIKLILTAAVGENLLGDLLSMSKFVEDQDSRSEGKTAGDLAVQIFKFQINAHSRVGKEVKLMIAEVEVVYVDPSLLKIKAAAVEKKNCWGSCCPNLQIPDQRIQQGGKEVKLMIAEVDHVYVDHVQCEKELPFHATAVGENLLRDRGQLCFC